MIGVLLMSFGTASDPDDVPRYLASVRGNSTPPDDVVAEFRRRFAQVGGSPLIAITRAQAAALETRLNAEVGDEGYRVRVGMRHSEPFIADGLADLADAERVVAIVMSPQYSPAIMGGYVRAVEEAVCDSAAAPVDLRLAGPWHEAEPFLEALAERVREGVERLPARQRETTPVVFTAHSLPRKVAESEPAYIQQLKTTASEVATRAGLAAGRWTFAYQSAGHTRDEWLTPDIKDLLPDIRSRGHEAVLVAPVQFLADHLEVLYDIDIAACEEAEKLGIKLSRIEMLNTHPGLIRALADVVRRELGASAA